MNQFHFYAKFDFSTFKKIMPFCEVFGLDRRRFEKKSILKLSVFAEHASMFMSQCFVIFADLSRPIKIVLVLSVNQSHALGFFFPSKS